MSARIGWGFIGSGSISNRFIPGLLEVSDAYLAAVSSRTEEKASSFAAKYGAKACKSYEEVVLDKNVDVIYVATPHTLHIEHTLLALKHGKPVLCEKPMAPNAVQVQTMISAAREKKLFLMEAMWTRFFPAMKKVRSWLANGEIGKVHYVTADFGFATAENPSSRLFDPRLAGGSLLDVGVYAVSFASMVFGKKPNRIESIADMASTGVDARMGCILGYEGGGIASLFSAVFTNTPQEARIVGEYGYIVIPRFWQPKSAFLYKKSQIAEEYFMDHPGEGFQFEVAAVQADIRAGRTENVLMPLDETLAIAETMDLIRSKWGLVYPFENKK